MKLGIVGLPNVGKSTLFNAITQAGAEAANYPFCTIDPNVGVVEVPDPRLENLAKLTGTKRVIPAAIEFYDIAGLVRGASEGEGLGNKFLANIREVDAIVELIRCFDDPNIVHVDGEVDPLRDIETINLELILSDLEMIEKRRERVEKQAKADKALRAEAELLAKVEKVLSEGKSARILDLTEDEKKILRGFQLLSSKPIIYVANVSEDEVGTAYDDNLHVQAIKEFAESEGAEYAVISAAIEEELTALEEEEQKEFLESMGVEESGLDQLVRTSYATLGLISYITTGEKETRAWTIKEGTKAVDAAGKIHTDISRGFICADTITYEELMKQGSMQKARDNGVVRQEGRDYIVKDGDVMLFKFNV